jgi:HPt (histidine-containing phosphotransfer) domain-containing protein
MHSEFLNYSPALQQQLADLYRKTMSVDLLQLSACVAAQDASGVERLAHRIRGSAQGLFAKNLVATCTEMEQQSGDKILDSLSGLMTQLLAQHEDFLVELTTYFTASSTDDIN